MGSTIVLPKKFTKTIKNTSSDIGSQTPSTDIEENEFCDSKLCHRYKFVRCLGHGSYGDVCLAKSTSKNVHNHQLVTIKKMEFHHVSDAKRLLRELTILRILNDHNSIIQLVDILPPEHSEFDKIYFIYKYSANVDLAQFLFDSHGLSRRSAQNIMYQILTGLKYMHSAGIIHRDLKPANILMDTNHDAIRIQICDFGLARGINRNPFAESYDDDPQKEQHQMTKSTKNMLAQDAEEERKRYTCVTNHVVTRWYRPPEVILFSQRREYLPLIDMWGFGCIMSEVMMLMAHKRSRRHHIIPLFPGKTCFPLSATRSDAYKDRFDQLNCIFNVIGTPRRSEVGKLRDVAAREYLERKPFKEPADLQKKFKYAKDAELKLLRGLLEFDVEKRLTAEQALRSEFFDDVRDMQQEKIHDKIELFDFEDVYLDLDDVRGYIRNEISYYN